MKALRSALIAGLLPVIAFTVIEDQFGVIWGLVAGMVFGVGEIIWEWRTAGKVQAMTWGGNGLLLVLGGVSLFSQEGVWFKLQPAILEAVMAVILMGSVIVGKPLLVMMAKKQGTLPEAGMGPGQIHPELHVIISGTFSGFSFRMGVFFALHAALATWAALHWTTTQWALLKGLGFTISFLAYGVVEVLVLRYRISQHARGRRPQSPTG